MMIHLTDVEKSFHAKQVLKGVSFTVGAGERVSLIGAGGCGKTVILKIMLGLLSPDDGRVEMMQVQVSDTEDPQWTEVLKKVGIAFQQGGLFDFMTVRQNLLFAMHRMTDFSRKRMEEKITFLLDKIKLPNAAELFPHELSGGMQRRVGIARALSTEPVIAIFDDPTAGLDPVTSTIILNMIRDMSANPESALLIATSNVETALRFAQRIIVVNEGRVIADGDWCDRAQHHRHILLHGPAWVRHFLSTRLIGISLEAAHQLRLPQEFIAQHWQQQ